MVQKKKRLSNTSDRPISLLVLPLLFIILLPILTGCELIGQTDVYYLDVKPASSVQGHISPVSREFEAGSEVTIQARPHTSWNWEFSHWEGDITGTDNPVTFTIDRDMKAVAHFQGQKLPLVIEIVGEGHVEHRVLGSSDPYSDDPAPSYRHATRVQVLAVSAEGWKFDVWRGQDFTFNRLTNPEDINMLDKRTVRAYFVRDN